MASQPPGPPGPPAAPGAPQAPGPPPPAGRLLTGVDHVGIACHDLSAAIGRYESLFGMVVAHRERNEEQGVSEAILWFPQAGTGLAGTGLAGTGLAGTGLDNTVAAYVQLLEPLGPDTPVGRFLASRGEGIHHVGYRVTDITAALASIGGAGVRLLDARPRHGSMGASIAFLHPRDIGGVLTELVQPAEYSGKEDL